MRTLRLAFITTITFGLAPSPAAAATYVVNSTQDRVDAAPGNGVCADVFGLCTLRAAVQEANATPTTFFHVAQLAPGALYDLSNTGAGEDGSVTGDLDVRTNLAVWVPGGPTGARAEVRGLSADRVFDVHPGHYLYLYQVDVTGGAVASPARGGAIRARDAQIFTRYSRVASSRAGNGGCISLDGGSKGLLDATLVTKCQAPAGAGGAIWASASQLTLQNGSVVYGNSSRSGGGISAEVSRIGVYDAVFEQNFSSLKSGGAIQSVTASSALEVHRTSFLHNQASHGGAIHNWGGAANVSDSYFLGNRTYASTLYDGSGGAILSNAYFATTGPASKLTVHNSHFKFNVAQGPGGAIALGKDDTTAITRTTFEVNVAAAGSSQDHHGGGIAQLDTGAALTVENSTFSGNASADPGAYGGGLFSQGFANLRYNTFYLNTSMPAPPWGFPGGGDAIVSLLGGWGMAHGNIFFSGGSDDACVGANTLTDLGFNLADDFSCLNHVTSSPFFVLQPTPANHGGDPTASGSPPPTLEMISTFYDDWIPTGSCSVATDQRGFGRPAGGGCAVGAYEPGAVARKAEDGEDPKGDPGEAGGR